MAWSDINQERRDARNRRNLLGKILTGRATLKDVKLDRTLIGFQEIGFESAGFIFCEGEKMLVSEFQGRASLHKNSIIFQEVERKVEDQVHEEKESAI